MPILEYDLLFSIGPYDFYSSKCFIMSVKVDNVGIDWNWQVSFGQKILYFAFISFVKPNGYRIKLIFIGYIIKILDPFDVRHFSFICNRKLRFFDFFPFFARLYLRMRNRLAD